MVMGSSRRLKVLDTAMQGDANPRPELKTLAVPDAGFGDGPGYIRTAFWAATEKPKGTVVLMNGRTECIERYQQRAELWLQRGYQVFSFDWRGQGGSTRFLKDPAIMKRATRPISAFTCPISVSS